MIVKGPFALSWRGNTLQDIEAVEMDYETNSEDYEASSGHVYQLDKSIKASIRLTLLSTDISSLAAVLPQYFVVENGQLSDGNFVFDSRGALDIKPDDCDTDEIHGDLDLIACNNPEETIRLKNAKTTLEGIEIGKIRKIVVKFVGEPEAGQSLIQFIGAQGENDFLLLDDGDLFELDNGENLILTDIEPLLLDDGEGFLLDDGDILLL